MPRPVHCYSYSCLAEDSTAGVIGGSCYSLNENTCPSSQAPYIPAKLPLKADTAMQPSSFLSLQRSMKSHARARLRTLEDFQLSQETSLACMH
mmetsp:Transcript_13388/g.36297  ORF Transcript_13388/g.36297 Transcript_13388/m.36297 type:complete len:93 (+) Transcript_13388:1189-1467(+)